MAEQDDMEALYAQMEQQYEEEEKKKKAEKKSKKKGGKDDDGADGQPEAEKEKGGKKAAKPAKKPTPASEKPASAKDVVVEEKKEPVKESTEAKPKEDSKKKADKKPAPKVEEKKQSEATSQEPEETKGGKKPAAKDAKGGKKKPSAIAALKEALAASNQVEEKLKREEEEKQRKEEEARLAKLEEEKREKERREKKKQMEKARIARLKAEGKYLTKEQKEAKQRTLLQLQAMGARIPLNVADGNVDAEATAAADAAAAAAAEKAKPKYTRIRKNKQNNATETSGSTAAEQSEENKQQKGEDNVKDAWDASSDEGQDEESVKSEWDAESDDDKKSSLKKKPIGSSTTSGISSAPTVTTNRTATKQSDGEDSDDGDSDSQESAESSESDIESDGENKDLPLTQRIRLRLQKRHEEAEKLRSVENLRSPVICVLGHVDTGKTKILDNLRRTRVQEDEAGGITQQIGATNVPLETIQERTKMCRHVYKNLIKIPGLLIIDTPGHEAFKSLRTRGSSLCDIAILVIDIMHGLEPQTIESINILKDKKTPFVVALNKIDRLLDWKTAPHTDVVQAIDSQLPHTKSEFERRTAEVITQLAEQGLNAALYYKNTDIKSYISMVPTSAHTSDGIGNLMALITEFSQTMLAKRVSYSKELQCTVMEVKAIPGLGTTIDVCLVNGKLKVCDTIIIPGQEGPIVTQVRGLLLPQPNRELRVKNSYVMNKEVHGAQGVKIAAKELEKAMAGLPLFVANKPDEIEYYKNEIDSLLRHVLSSIKLSDTGVFVQASTLGSLEALLEFLRTSKIPYAGISIGPVHKKDVTMASIMLEKDPQYAVILAFDVKVERDAQDMADHVGVKIFTADIIYHLFDKFMGYRDELKQKKREEFKDVAVFPFKIKILPEFIFNTRDPIIIGVRVEAGFLKIGAPVCAVCEDVSAEREGKDKFVDLGRITSIEFNHKQLEVAKQGQEVCIKIENTTGGAPKLLGRHFLQTDMLVSRISRDSIDAVKNYFREEMSKNDWQLIIELKKLFLIM